MQIAYDNVEDDVLYVKVDTDIVCATESPRLDMLQTQNAHVKFEL